MCGSGMEGEREDAQFTVAGIELVYQDCKHPTYNQHSVADSVPGLSIIDAFMNYGFSNVSQRLVKATGCSSVLKCT